jgi:hypothetical protein
MKVRKGSVKKLKYETKIPPMGQRELENTKQALRLLKSFQSQSWRISKS